MKKSTVRIYDTISKEYVDIEVSEEVYTYYNRSQWNMDDNDDSFYKHEIQFSALIGGNDGTFENFREFRIENSVEKEVISKLFTEKLYECLNLLSASDRQLIEMLFFEGKTERECAAYYGISQKNINKKKRRIWMLSRGDAVVYKCRGLYKVEDIGTLDFSFVDREKK